MNENPCIPNASQALLSVVTVAKAFMWFGVTILALGAMDLTSSFSSPKTDATYHRIIITLSGLYAGVFPY